MKPTLVFVVAVLLFMTGCISPPEGAENVPLVLLPGYLLSANDTLQNNTTAPTGECPAGEELVEGPWGERFCEAPSQQAGMACDATNFTDCDCVFYPINGSAVDYCLEPAGDCNENYCVCREWSPEFKGECMRHTWFGCAGQLYDNGDGTTTYGVLCVD